MTADGQSSNMSANVERFSGFATIYDRYRPAPPPELRSWLCRYAGVSYPQLVVDIASGTGLSTRIWLEQATTLIGIEPNADMRAQAEQHMRAGYSSGKTQLSFRAGSADATGLPDACADIVTISQALHWLEPMSTFTEAARILRPGGVFAAYDCDWPPALDWQVEAAYNACMDRAYELEQRYQTGQGVQRWNKDWHLARMAASGKFRYTHEIVMHRSDFGTTARLIGLALSQGSLAGLWKIGLSEDEIGITALRAIAEQRMGLGVQPWLWSYRVRIGVV